MARVVLAIVERHADEAAFLYEQRERAVASPLFDLSGLRTLDERLAANLDGLVLAGSEGLRVGVAELERASRRTRNPDGELFAASHVAAALGDNLALSKLIAVAQRAPRHEHALASALEWLRLRPARRVLKELLAEECPPLLHRIAIAAHDARREDPGAALRSALASEDAGLRVAACRAAGHLGRRDLLPTLNFALGDPDDSVRGWAASAAALLGDRPVVDVLWTAAASGHEDGPSWADLAARVDEPSTATARIEALAGADVTLRAAIAAAAASGDPSWVPWLLDIVDRNPPLARRAAWAFTTIIGGSMDPPLFLPKRASEPGELDLILGLRDPHDDLPAPVGAELRARWAAVRSGFREGQRFLGGRALNVPWLRECLREGPQPWRAAAAIEFCCAAPGACLFPVRAPGPRQAALLNKIPLAAG